MRVLWVLLGLLSASACNRVDEPAATTSDVPRPEPIAARPKVRGQLPVSEDTTMPACWLQTPAEPPPAAEAALNCPAEPDPAPTLPRGSVHFPDLPGSPRVEVEIARTDPHRARGLMYRTELAALHGMLFSWTSEEPRTFWMRNTCIPLDMLFIAEDGRILGILEQVPVMNDDPRTVPCPAAHVLEVNAGFCRTHGLKAGMRVALD